ncbi:MerR family transcriptional regulator [Pseudahrensia aquimaris]|uniref:MerR family transcriptional regulator n=1 Tax=Pseudahrensia aquimaris TaxID=744461 RepID=A0ABW3FHK1_9HYPH
MSRFYKIGDLAKEFGVTLRTLRFYEDKGLIQPSRSGTTRLYSPNDREKLRVALFCKRIGLSLTEIGDVLALHESSADDVPEKIRLIYADRLKALEDQRIETERTIADLQNKIESLSGKAKH